MHKMRIILNLSFDRSPMPDSPDIQQLYRSHHSWLVGWLFRRVQSRCDAADLSQETFLRLLTGSVAAQDLREPRAFLSTIARRLIFDRHRRRQLESAYLERLSSLPEQVAPSPEEQLLLVEALVAIDRALAGLPAIVKAAFLYSQLDGLSYVEIGRKLELSERTVSRYMKQALRQCYLTEVTP